MYYYGFNSDGRCVFSANDAVAPIEGVTVIPDERNLDIMNIVMLQSENGPIITDRIKTSEEILAELESYRQSLMQTATNNISLLSDVAELDNDAAAAEMVTKWRAYRVELYKLDLTVESVVWPPVPEAVS